MFFLFPVRFSDTRSLVQRTANNVRPAIERDGRALVAVLRHDFLRHHRGLLRDFLRSGRRPERQHLQTARAAGQRIPTQPSGVEQARVVGSDWQFEVNPLRNVFRLLWFFFFTTLFIRIVSIVFSRRSTVVTLKLSPNLRTIMKPPKKGVQLSTEEMELEKLSKALESTREPTVESVHDGDDGDVIVDF